jgi:hypothetical protein
LRQVGRFAIEEHRAFYRDKIYYTSAYALYKVPLRSVMPARGMYTKPSHSGAKIATPVGKRASLRGGSSRAFRDCFLGFSRPPCTALCQQRMVDGVSTVHGGSIGIALRSSSPLAMLSLTRGARGEMARQVPYFVLLILLDYGAIPYTDALDLFLTLWVLFGYFAIFLFQ